VNKRSNAFYTLWTGAIFLCLLLSLIAVFVPSCTKATASAAKATPTVQATTAPEDDQATAPETDEPLSDDPAAAPETD
jgi:hypothetical protein